jgi:altronate hydrolase
MRRTIKIHASDNVAVALTSLGSGVRIADGYAEVITSSEIPRGHKVALADLDLGQPVIKYGFSIGKATQRIHSGGWIHTHNLETALGQNVEYRYLPGQANVGLRSEMNTTAASDLRRDTRKEFYGYRRTNGKTGTRNEIWIINTVACVNNAADRIARTAHEQVCGKQH